MTRLLRVFARVRELEALVDNADQAKAKVSALLDQTAKWADEEISNRQRECQVVTKALQESEMRASTLEDRLNAAYEDRQRLWDLVQSSLAGERTAYQSGLNLQWQKEGFGAPYPDAPQMPLHKVPREVENSFIPRSMTGSERVAQGTREFMTAYKEKCR